MKLGALEAGGTKMVCSIGDEQGRIADRVSIPTLLPEETLEAISAYFEGKGIEALGVAGFGPLDLNPQSPTYGYVTTSPKLAWQHCALVPTLKARLHVPIGIDTDVGAAALSEFMLGAGKGVNNLVYLTVGTGIGGGVIAGGKLVHGLVHPEAGHFILRAHPKDPAPDGFCPFHKGCFEGLAKGPTFDARWGVSSKDLPEGHIGWEIEAYYLAQFCVAMLMILSTEKIVLGGGVMQQAFLFPMIREKTRELMGGYIASDMILEHIDQLIVPPGLGVNSGVTGALLLAAQALGIN
ncbi:MAG: ROK family protein [Clostridia bacterium]